MATASWQYGTMPSPPAVPLLSRCVNALTLNPSAFAWLFAPKLTSLGFYFHSVPLLPRCWPALSRSGWSLASRNGRVGREQVTMALGCLMIVRMELRYRNLLLGPDYIAELKAWG
ncbi:hypothetical protein EDC15_102144 [Acetobacter aceti NBRC 14818]|nr:hypothetical protein EDC15_102144 [Acetobacter aceti NBRC 14818]